MSDGHVFISYARVDADEVDKLELALAAAGVPVWRDSAKLWPGDNWRLRIKQAIAEDALVVIACFSSRSVARAVSYQNEELALAIEQMRRRRPGVPWLIPVRFDDCRIPDLDISGGHTLRSLHWVDLFGSQTTRETARLVETVRRIFGLDEPVSAAGSAREAAESPPDVRADRADALESSGLSVVPLPEPDARWASISGDLGPDGRMRPMSFEILAELASGWAALLSDHVISDGPAKLLAMARSQFTHSWFNYEFMAAACLTGLAALEAAFRVLYPADEQASFGALIARARRDGILSESLADAADAGAELRDSFSHPQTQVTLTLGTTVSMLENSHRLVALVMSAAAAGDAAWRARNAASAPLAAGSGSQATLSYMGRVRQIAATTSNFEGREDWLRRLASFAHGSDGYLLIEGEQFAGKTALLARFVTAHVPQDVEVVAYFASRRMYSADISSFLSEVVPQLAAVAGTDIPVDTQRLTAFWSLWDLAARAVSGRRHHLLLVVDGLDEDLPPAPGSSRIAAILPANAGRQAGKNFAHAHVLVSNREKRQLDVSAGHPLALSAAEKLTRLPMNKDYELLARQEIAGLLQVPDARNFLGAMAAAGGALSEADLVRLTGLSGERVREFLARAERCLPPLGDGRYAFDSEFLEQLRAIPDLEVSRHRSAIDAWADEWRQRGWRDEHGDAPRYMLEVYPATFDREPVRRAALVGDPLWIAAAIRQLHVDTVLGKLDKWLRASAGGIAPMLAIVRGQAAFLRSEPDLDRGKILRQLCLQAAELDEPEQAAAFQAALRGFEGLVPMWSSRRPYRALIAEINGRAGWVNAVALLPGGRIVAGADDGRVWLWDPNTPSAESRTIGQHDGPVRALAVLADGRVVSGGDDRRVHVWDPNPAGSVAVELGRHDGAVRALAVLDADRVVSGGDDWSVRIWSVGGHPERAGKLGQHAGNIRGLAVDRSGRVVSAGDDGCLSLWDPDSPGTPVTRTEARGVGMRIMTVAVGPDQSVFAGGNDGVIYRWYHRFCDRRSDGDDDLPYERLEEFGSHGNVVRGIAATQDGLTISGADDSLLRLWQDAPGGTDRIELGRHDGAVRTVSARDGRAVSGGRDQKVRFWDISEQQLAVRRRSGPAERMSAVSLCSDGWTVSSGLSKRLWLWDPDRQREPTVIGRTDSPALAICSLAGRTFITADASGVIQTWDRSAPGKPLAGQLAGQHPGALLCLAGDYLITAGYDGTVRRWNLTDLMRDSGRESPGSMVLGQHSSAVVAITALPQGRVATGSVSGDVIVWQPRDPGAEDRGLEPIGGRLNALCYLSDVLIAGGDDGRLHVWDLLSDQTRTSFPAHDGAWLTSLAACGSYLISAGTDGRLVTWERQAGGMRVRGQVATMVTEISGCCLADGEIRLAAAHSDGGLSYWILGLSDGYSASVS